MREERKETKKKEVVYIWVDGNGLTEAEYKTLLWERDWEKTPEHQKELILTVFPEVANLDKSTIHRPTPLLRQALIRLEMDDIEKVKEPCGRCGGSGTFSFNLIHGTMCYGCNGKGYVIKSTKAFIVRMLKQLKKTSYIPLCERQGE